jgi:hypothetical protein
MNSSAHLPAQTDKHLHESQSLRNSTAALRRQSRSNWSLPKSLQTEIFAERAGDFRQFRSRDYEITRCAVWRLSRTRESRHFRAFEAQVTKCRQTQEWLAGAGRFERRYGESESDVVPRPTGIRTVFKACSAETVNSRLREPYQITGVRSSGEKQRLQPTISETGVSLLRHGPS